MGVLKDLTNFSQVDMFGDEGSSPDFLSLRCVGFVHGELWVFTVVGCDVNHLLYFIFFLSFSLLVSYVPTAPTQHKEKKNCKKKARLFGVEVKGALSSLLITAVAKQTGLLGVQMAAMGDFLRYVLSVLARINQLLGFQAHYFCESMVGLSKVSRSWVIHAR